MTDTSTAAPSARLRQLSRPTATSPVLLRALERVHLTLAGGVLIAGAVGGWLLARWIGSRTLYLLVYAILVVMAASFVVARRRLGLEVDRSRLSARMREGQSAEVTLVVRASRRATTLIIEEQLPLAFGPVVRVPVGVIEGGAEIEHTYTFSPRLRGVYEVGPAMARWSDPFGLTTQSQQLAEPTKVIVHPATELVHDRILARMWEDPPIRPPSSKPWPTGFEFYGMRDYVRGDDLRRVVWAAVAKTGRLMVRESEQGITDRVSIVLDTHDAWHKPGSPSDTFETAVRVAASIGLRHLGDGLSVTISTNEARLGESLRGPRAKYALLDQLAMVSASDAPLAAAGPFLMADARRRSHFVIVTPHIDKDMTTRMRLVLDRGASIVVVKIVWDESDPQSLARAASLGCQVVQVPIASSIERAFTHQVGGGLRR